MTTLELTYVVSLDKDLCSAGRACLLTCKYGGLMHVPGERQPMIDPWSCSGCGTCISVCPQEALRLIPRATA